METQGETLLEDCVYYLEKLMGLIEEDRTDVQKSLVGEPLNSYRELTGQELEILAWSKRYLEGG